MFEKGFFNGAFDFNRDGKLDAFERAADFAAFHQMMAENEKEDDDLSLFDDEDEEYEDEFDDEDEYDLDDEYEDEDFESDDFDF